MLRSIVATSPNVFMTLPERQKHIVQLVKFMDKCVVEKAGVHGAFYHYQKPHALPGDRESVCIVGPGGTRQYLPYTIEEEQTLAAARDWVRTGVGPVPGPASLLPAPPPPPAAVDDEADTTEIRRRRGGSRGTVPAALIERSRGIATTKN